MTLRWRKADSNSWSRFEKSRPSKTRHRDSESFGEGTKVKSPHLQRRNNFYVGWTRQITNSWATPRTSTLKSSRREAERVPTGEEVGFSLGGTDGSNPPPSRRESIANLTPADAERPGRSFCREGRGRGASYPREPAVRRISRPQPRCSSPPARIMSCLTCCEEWS